MKVIRRDDPPRDQTPHQVSFGAGPLVKTYFFYEKNTGVSHFHIEAAPDGQCPVEEAAGLLAMHCMVRGSSPRDYVVMVEAAHEALEGLTEKAEKLLQAGHSVGNSVMSVAEGAYDRFEFGYTRNFHHDGSTAGLSNLWASGFNIFHGKVGVLKESRRLRPAVSLGFVARTQVGNIGGVLQNKNTTNADFYAVATKTADIRKLPLVFNFGFKITNASLLGLAGNAPGYQGRFFGAVAFALKGPGRSTILVGSEALQEPRRVLGKVQA